MINSTGLFSTALCHTVDKNISGNFSNISSEISQRSRGKANKTRTPIIAMTADDLTTRNDKPQTLRLLFRKTERGCEWNTIGGHRFQVTAKN